MSEHVFAESLPDLVDASEYVDYPRGQLVRIRISVTENGVVVLGDGLRPELVERALAELGPEVIEQMLCG